MFFIKTIYNSYGFLLGKVLQSMQTRFEERVKSYSIVSKHYGVMLVINTTPNVSQKEIGEILRIDRTTMVTLVDYLENLDYIKRIKNPDDRRAYYLCLTDKGSNVLDECWDILQESELSVLEPLQDEDKLKLKDWILKIYNL